MDESRAYAICYDQQDKGTHPMDPEAREAAAELAEAIEGDVDAEDVIDAIQTWRQAQSDPVPDEETVDRPDERRKDRVYVESPEEAPEDANVQEGDYGGYYYEVGGSESDSSEFDEESAMSIAQDLEEQFGDKVLHAVIRTIGQHAPEVAEAMATTASITLSDEAKQKRESGTGNLIKARVYVEDPDEAPDHVNVQEGEQGGIYYEPEYVDGESSSDSSQDDPSSASRYGDLGDPSEMSHEEQKEALTPLYQWNTPNPNNVTDEKLKEMESLRNFMGDADDEVLADVITDRVEDEYLVPHHMVSHLSGMDDEQVSEVVAESVELAKDDWQRESVAGVVKVFSQFLPDADHRRMVVEQYEDDVNEYYEDLAMEDEEPKVMREMDWYKSQFPEDADEWFNSFLENYVSDGTSNWTSQSMLGVIGGMDINEDTYNWTGGEPVDELEPTPEQMEAINTIRDRAAESFDSDRVMYRGVKSEVTAHSQLESWTPEEELAEKFAGEDGRIMAAEVDPGDVLYHEDMDVDKPAYMNDDEIMVLGGSFR